MVKNVIVASVIAFGLIGCNSAQLMSAANSAMGSSSATSAATTSSLAAANGGAALAKGCVPRMSGGSASFTEMITEQLVNAAIEAALKEVVGDQNIVIPTKIMDTCTADKRLAYVKSITRDFAIGVDEANRNILASVEQTQEIQKLQAQMDHKKKTLSEADYYEEIADDNEQMLILMENAKVTDTAKYSAAMGELAIATPATGYTIVGWDKEILEFAKDNIAWGIKNVGSVTDLGSQLSTMVQILPTLASLTTSPLYDGRVDEAIAKKAGEAQIKSDEEIAAKAEAENGFGDA